MDGEQAKPKPESEGSRRTTTLEADLCAASGSWSHEVSWCSLMLVKPGAFAEASNLTAMASSPIAMASNLIGIVSNLIAMASNLSLLSAQATERCEGGGSEGGVSQAEGTREP